MRRLRLGLNVDHIATVRQARGGDDPDPVAAAAIGEMAGASGIVVHIRGDRRHIQERDISLLRQTVKTWLNVEMAATEEMIAIAEKYKLDRVTLVPERPGEITTEGGLNVVGNFKVIKATVDRLKEAGIETSIFADPDREQIKASAETGCEIVEINTDAYSRTRSEHDAYDASMIVQESAEYADGLGLRVAAGHGLNYHNVVRIAAIHELEELNIGHAIIARSTLHGIDRAVRDMIALFGPRNF